jgi:hypothetical protein
LLFSMERLSVNPYSIRRLHPTSDGLPFSIDVSIAEAVSGETVESLHASGSLFYADHRSLASLAKTTTYAAACDAYFYIHPKTRDFLPLAIRPNVGSHLIYTPQDPPNDWLLAKMMFNSNDLWFGQWYHFGATHEVVEIVYEAAIRSLSDDHPVLALLSRSKLSNSRQRSQSLPMAPSRLQSLCISAPRGCASAKPQWPYRESLPLL